MVNSPKLVIVAGAGSTYSDGETKRPRSLRPPLGKGFFQQCSWDKSKIVTDLLSAIMRDLNTDYKLDPIGGAETNDDLEYILTKVYTDVNVLHSSRTTIKSREDLLRNLIKLLNTRLAKTTNALKTKRTSGIGKIISWYLKHGFKPEDICIITFNYDLHIEKTLLLLNDQKQHHKHEGKILNFPYLYNLKDKPVVLRSQEKSIKKFPKASYSTRCISLLKLHGSLNWFSLHTSSNPSIKALFNTKRNIRIKQSKDVNVVIHSPKSKQAKDIFPVIIPPIIGKGAVIPKQMARLWPLAENWLDTATEVIVFGYSFPVTDSEGVHMLENTIGQSQHCRHIFSINPDPSVITRMGMIPKRKPVTLFPNINSFMNFLKQI
ncbi:MAG: hypothetical protein ACR2PR_03135 [Pseudohongiellaceae bacterium]